MAEDRFPFLGQFLNETSNEEPVRTDKTMQLGVSSVLSIKMVDLPRNNIATTPGEENPYQLSQTSLGGVSSVLSVASLRIPRKRTLLPQEIPLNFVSETPKNRGDKTDKTLSGRRRSVPGFNRPESPLRDPGETPGDPWDRVPGVVTVTWAINSGHR